MNTCIAQVCDVLVLDRQICRPHTTPGDHSEHDRRKWWQTVKSVALAPLLVITAPSGASIMPVGPAFGGAARPEGRPLGLPA
jgi:hypothetical protein